MELTNRTSDMADSILETKERVRVPLFPVYSEVRHLLRVWPGFKRTQVTSYQSTLAKLRGTPQNPVDWTHPQSWIPERLEGEDLALAEAVWKVSKGAVNPRHVYGHWLLAQKYRLLQDDGESVLHLSPMGRNFLKQPGGEVELAIDECEGLVKLLAIVADNGPAPAAGLLGDWSDYLLRRSRFGKDSTFKDTMRRRLKNVVERALVERNGNLYSVTTDGLDYLEKTEDEDVAGGDTHHQIRVLVRQHERGVRENLLELLLNMEPTALEQVIKRLLEEMDYQNVEVTAPSGDGGVDVVGDIELGITSIREVVQVKRHRKTIQRNVLDALRGSLHRFNAVRGTIITTSRFTKGTQNAAFETGAAPITLIDGEKLVELLIEHDIGVRKRGLPLLEIDADALLPVEHDG